ncbi:MAG TPA: ribosome biogenesis GTPase Der, partial [bacterium]|nr:ribosome biogenesis GTPase Der [bacterium]
MRFQEAIPVVAIIGRPNVGKSTLFNRIGGVRSAVIHDEAGTTRDRNYARAEWYDRSFWIVDTGGTTFERDSDLTRDIQEQVDAAIEEADVILFLLDATTGVTTDDEAVIRRLARTKKPVVASANKADDAPTTLAASGLTAGGLGEVFPISAKKGSGVEELLDHLMTILPQDLVPAPSTAEDARVAIVGRPNVGKSSLVNAITGEKTVIVADAPGTTRDAIDTPVRLGEATILLIDTAGLRRRARIAESVEFWSSLRSLRAIERADVAVVVLDASTGILDQDVWIASEANRLGKAVVVVVNKWDAVEKDADIALRFEDRFRWHFKFLPDAPILYVSAKSGRRVDRILPEALRLAEVRARQFQN